MVESYIRKPLIGVLIAEVEEILMNYKSLELLNRNITMDIVQNMTIFLREDVNTNDLMNAFDQIFEKEIGKQL
jgi:hypothetical protein